MGEDSFNQAEIYALKQNATKTMDFDLEFLGIREDIRILKKEFETRGKQYQQITNDKLLKLQSEIENQKMADDELLKMQSEIQKKEQELKTIKKKLDQQIFELRKSMRDKENEVFENVDNVGNHIDLSNNNVETKYIEIKHDIAICTPSYGNVKKATIQNFIYLREVWNITLPFYVFSYTEQEIGWNKDEQEQVKKLVGGELHFKYINDMEIGGESWGAYVKRKNIANVASKFLPKIAAMIWCPGKHTILIDHDTIFLQNPMNLIQEKLYINHGAMFFQDVRYYNKFNILCQMVLEKYNELNPQNKLDTIKDMKDSLGNEICDPINTHIQCSSLVVINKEMHDDIITKILDVKLSLTETDAVDAEHSGWIYTASNYGDKEAYWETFLLYKHHFILTQIG